jgi:hypothetical protein
LAEERSVEKMKAELRHPFARLAFWAAPSGVTTKRKDSKVVHIKPGELFESGYG